MIRSDIRSRVSNRLGLPSTGDGLLTDTILNECIASALVDICNEHDWPWLLTSTSLTLTSGSASIPSDALKLRELVINSDRALYVPLGEYLENSDRARCVWTDQGSTVVISPTPASALSGTLYYVRAEPALSSDSSVPLLPDAHIQALVCRASYHANVRRHRTEDMGVDRGEYEDAISKMRDATRRRSGPRQVRDRERSRWAVWA